MPKVSDLFEIYSGSNLVLMDLEEDLNGVNFIGASGTNNGITGRVIVSLSAKVFEAGLISVACKGSVLSSFVQLEPFVTGVNMKVLKPKREMLDIEKWFYCYCIHSNSKYFSFGRQADNRLGDIELPDKIPDWVYDCKLELPETKVDSEIPELHTENWKSFKLGDLFDIETGTYSSTPSGANESEIIIPFVSELEVNNGVSAVVGFTNAMYDILNMQVDGENKLFKGNCITISNSTTPGFACYQPNDFIAMSTVSVLRLKVKDLNKFIAMFICACISTERWRFNKARKWNMQRMPFTEIKLPVTSSGEPDWNIMELYMRSLPYSDLIKDI